jgi:septum site-determining protein MinD
VPESQDVLSASNAGVPVILNDGSDASQAYDDAVSRLLGEVKPLRFTEEPKKGFFSRMFGG